MKLNFITFMVRDLNKSVAFYEEIAGLKVVKRMNPEAGQIAFIANDIGETMLELIAFEGAEKVSVEGMTMSFSVEDCLETLRKRAVEKGYEASDIIDQKPKPKYFSVKDPDGIIVEFGEKIN